MSAFSAALYEETPFDAFVLPPARNGWDLARRPAPMASPSKMSKPTYLLGSLGLIASQPGMCGLMALTNVLPFQTGRRRGVQIFPDVFDSLLLARCRLAPIRRHQIQSINGYCLTLRKGFSIGARIESQMPRRGNPP